MFQRLAIEKFHGDEGFAVHFADVVNGANAGMIQCGGRFGFSLESRERLLVSGDIVRKEFERHEAVQAGVFGFVNDTHSATAEFLDDAVMRNRLIQQGVRLWRHLADILGWCEERSQGFAKGSDSLVRDLLHSRRSPCISHFTLRISRSCWRRPTKRSPAISLPGLRLRRRLSGLLRSVRWRNCRSSSS